MQEEADAASKTWPQIEDKINKELFRGVYEDGEVVAYYVPVINTKIEAAKVESWYLSLVNQLKKFLTDLIPALLSSLIIVPIITVMLIKDGDRLARKMFSKVPNRYFEVVLSMAHDISRSIENFISAKAIQSLVVATICMIGFTLAGVKSPLLMAIVAGLLNIVPYIGPILGALPPIIMSYLLIDSRTAAFAFLTLVIAQLADNFFTQPVILPKFVNERPLVVILVTLIGAELFGAVGLVLAIAVYSIVKIIMIKSYNALDVIYSREYPNQNPGKQMLLGEYGENNDST